MCDEIGEQGTPHTHVYAAFENAKELSALFRRFYGAHIEAARGSRRENRDYIRKEGRCRDTEKAATNPRSTPTCSRRSEVLGLKWYSIDFDAGTITIRRTVSKATKAMYRSGWAMPTSR